MRLSGCSNLSFCDRNAQPQVADYAMSANIRNTTASRFTAVSTVAILSCTAAACGPGRVVGIGPQCAFSDPEFTTSLGICNLAAEYYLAKQEWPLSKEQLEEQNQRVLAQAGELPPEQAKEWSEFLGRFTLLDMKRQGE